MDELKKDLNSLYKDWALAVATNEYRAQEELILNKIKEILTIDPTTKVRWPRVFRSVVWINGSSHYTRCCTTLRKAQELRALLKEELSAPLVEAAVDAGSQDSNYLYTAETARLSDFQHTHYSSTFSAEL